MMDSVFIEDIDKFFLETINVQGLVPSKPTDPEYPSWKMEKVPVIYHLPESGIAPDFDQNIVTLFLYDMQLDTERLQSDIDLVIDRDETEFTITTKKVPIPYKLFYQFDLWSLKQSSLVRMVQDFQMQFQPRTSILVPDHKDDLHDLFMELCSSRNADATLWANAAHKTDKRFFRRIFRYCVHAELDSSKVQVHQMVKEVNINDPNPM